MTTLDLSLYDEAAIDDLATELPEDRAVDDAQAERAMRAVAAIDAQVERWEALARAEHDRIDRWLTETTNPLLGRREFFARCLETYTRANHDATGAKSVRLPSGTVQLRAGQPKVEPLRDPTEDSPPELVRVKRSWDRRALADHYNPGPVSDEIEAPPGHVAHLAVSLDGEVCDWCVVYVPVERSFSIRPARGEA